MTTTDVTAILERLTRIESKLDTQGDALTEIRSEVRKTNGRVTTLENREREDRARLDERSIIEQAQHDALVSWARPVIVGILVLAIGAAIVAALNLDKI